MSRHTPGPWRLMGQVHGASDTSDTIIYARSSWETKEILRTRYPENPNMWDFYLIAAAPELLQAAKALLEACYDADIRYGLPEEVDGSYLDAMRKAIAKAEGRE